MKQRLQGLLWIPKHMYYGIQHVYCQCLDESLFNIVSCDVMKQRLHCLLWIPKHRKYGNTSRPLSRLQGLLWIPKHMYYGIQHVYCQCLDESLFNIVSCDVMKQRLHCLLWISKHRKYGNTSRPLVCTACYGYRNTGSTVIHHVHCQCVDGSLFNIVSCDVMKQRLHGLLWIPKHRKYGNTSRPLTVIHHVHCHCVDGSLFNIVRCDVMKQRLHGLLWIPKHRKYGNTSRPLSVCGWIIVYVRPCPNLVPREIRLVARTTATSRNYQLSE
ncbi:hypothetical protein J6590_053819 [Homalodisca vitripennis]|nr:hypothetical protein J6590_053819 [Homalodisca vitripennis]